MLSVLSRRFFHASPFMRKIVQFHLADIGEGITECELIQWFVQPGATIAQFDKICEVQSDKATVEITSRYDGVVKKLHYKQGDIANVGGPLLDIDTGEDSVEAVSSVSSPPPTPAVANAVEIQSPAISQPSASPDSQIDFKTFATPAVRRIAKENNVDLKQINGSGKAGRVTKEDVLSFVKNGGVQQKASAPAPIVGADASPVHKVVPLSPVQKSMLKSMSRSLSIPHFGFSDTIRFSEMKRTRLAINRYLETLKEEDGKVRKISYMPLLLKSFSIALESFPLLNAQFVDASETNVTPHLIYRSEHNIAIAVDSPQGLVVPVVPSVNSSSILSIASTMLSLQQRAQQNKLALQDFKGASITVSNVGSIAGDVVSPVIVEGQVCIVGIGKVKTVAQWDENTQKFIPEEVVTVSFSADHRVVDGASVARFFKTWKAIVEDPVLMLTHLK